MHPYMLAAFQDELEKIAARFTGIKMGPIPAAHVQTIRSLGGVKPAQMANATAGAVANAPRPTRIP